MYLTVLLKRWSKMAWYIWITLAKQADTTSHVVGKMDMTKTCFHIVWTILNLCIWNSNYLEVNADNMKFFSLYVTGQKNEWKRE